jgi:hypothetical protein
VKIEQIICFIGVKYQSSSEGRKPIQVLQRCLKNTEERRSLIEKREQATKSSRGGIAKKQGRESDEFKDLF